MSDFFLPIFNQRVYKAINIACVISKYRTPIVAREVARILDINDAEVHTICGAMKGIITSMRSKGGGYVVSKADATVGDVIDCLMERYRIDEAIHMGRLKTAFGRILRVKLDDLIEEDEYEDTSKNNPG